MKPCTVLCLLLLVSLSVAQVPSLIPKPARASLLSGTFRLDSGAKFSVEGARSSLPRVASKILALEDGDPASIRFRIDKTLQLGEEGYCLKVSSTGIAVEAAKDQGLLNGLQTLRQLLPADLEEGKPWTAEIPCLEIEDQPQFAWRGLHLDVSRHFFPKEFIKRYLDLMAMLKLNVFHWHLIDDGGWRLEIKKYPELTRRGAFRALMEPVWAQSEIRFPEPGSEPTYGGFYTQEDVREIVAYAWERNIQVVPEIEMPGHAQPVFWAYPQLACQDAPLEEFRTKTGNQRPNVFCAGNDYTFDFIADVLQEVSVLFPSRYIHIGGDEVDKFLWERCSKCQKRMADLGLGSTAELQSYFIRRVEDILAGLDRRLIGWDEILEGGLAPNATVMSWRGISGGIAAAKSGHDVVMSPTSHSYFDYSYQSISTETAFSFNPIPDELNDHEAKFVLGGQANVWTEWIEDPATVERMVFPRILGMSEALWRADPERDFDEFRLRMRDFFPRLDALAVNYFVPAPEVEYDAVIIDRPTEVKFLETPVPGGVIRYTLDGTEPTASSQAYGEPILVSQPCLVTGALFLPKGQKSTSVRVHCVALPPQPGAPLEQGLLMRSAKGRWSKLPDFDSVGASQPRRVESIGLFEFDDTEEFGLEFTGFLKVEREGVYTFAVTSDDGSVLDIAGARVVDHDGLHGPVEKSGKVFLRAGTYPIRIAMFEAGGGEVLEVAVSGPGMERQPLSTSMLWRVAG